MGSPPEEPDRRPDEARVEVTLTRGFWIGKYEVTQGQWKRIVGQFPGAQPTGEGDDFPVVWVNYGEAEDHLPEGDRQHVRPAACLSSWSYRSSRQRPEQRVNGNNRLTACALLTALIRNPTILARG